VQNWENKENGDDDDDDDDDNSNNSVNKCRNKIRLTFSEDPSAKFSPNQSRVLWDKSYGGTETTSP